MIDCFGNRPPSRDRERNADMLDVTFAGAFLAGLLSFVTPCVLPIVPPYLCYLTGLSFSQLAGEDDLWWVWGWVGVLVVWLSVARCVRQHVLGVCTLSLLAFTFLRFGDAKPH